MHAKIKSVSNYKTIHDDNDSLLLLAEIKGISYKFESQKNIYVALDMAKSNSFSSRQGPNETNAAYMTRFKDSITVIEHYGGSIGDDIALINPRLPQRRFPGHSPHWRPRRIFSHKQSGQETSLRHKVTR